MNLVPLHLSVFLSLMLLPAFVHAQANARCPAVWIDGPSSDVVHGEPIIFNARLNANASSRPQFHWHTSAGTIISGQGTSSIKVDTVGLGGVTVIVRVTVSGVATTCPTDASRSANVYQEGIICALPFDQYGDIDFEDEKARLDNFAIQVSQVKDSTGYIFVYAGRRTYEGEAAERLLRVRRYVVEYRQIPADRIITVDAGYRDDLETVLIIGPKGATPPVAMPTISPHEVELTKPIPKARRKQQKS
ncbi:MAG TPA: hypothetical protein VIT88_07265 [Pyrinomonadaceae bacterium]